MKAACLCVQTAVTEESGGSVYSGALDVLRGRGVEIIDGGGAADASQAEKAAAGLMRGDPDILILVVLSGRSAPVIKAAGEMSTVPVLLWAIGKNFAFPSSALASGALEEAGRPFRLIHGYPENGETVSAAMETVCVSHAVTRLKGSKIGLIGGLFFNLVSCGYDPAIIKEKFGVELKPFSYDVLRSLTMKDGPAREDELNGLKGLCRSFCLKVPEDSLVPGLKLHMALKRLSERERLDAFAIECWTGLPKELGLNPCLGFIEDAYIIACEGDAVLSVMLSAIRRMTGRIPFVGDVQYIDENDIMTLSHCGASAALAADGDVVLSESAAAGEQGFPTVTCRPGLENGPVTLARLFGSKCDRIHMARGELVALDRADSYTALIRLSGGREDFIGACSGNHYIMVSGDIRAKLRLFGKWMRIDVKET